MWGYDRQSWVNRETLIDKNRIDHIEDGIYAESIKTLYVNCDKPVDDIDELIELMRTGSNVIGVIKAGSSAAYQVFSASSGTDVSGNLFFNFYGTDGGHFGIARYVYNASESTWDYTFTPIV